MQLVDGMGDVSSKRQRCRQVGHREFHVRRQSSRPDLPVQLCHSDEIVQRCHERADERQPSHALSHDIWINNGRKRSLHHRTAQAACEAVMPKACSFGKISHPTELSFWPPFTLCQDREIKNGCENERNGECGNSTTPRRQYPYVVGD